MKFLFILSLIGALIFGLSACEPANLTPSPEPEPTPSSGFEELIASANSSGELSSKLSYELKSVRVEMVKGEQSSFSYLVAELNLLTGNANSLKAIGMFWGSDTDSGFDARVFANTGDLEINGKILDLDPYLVISAFAKMPLKNQTIANASLILVDNENFFDEADALFFSNLKLHQTSSQLITRSNSFAFQAQGAESLMIGFGYVKEGDLGFWGDMDDLWLNYKVEPRKTVLGQIQQLTGLIGEGRNSAILFALALNLKPASTEKSIVLVCETCTGDVALSLPESGFVATDDLWLKLSLVRPLTLWVTGKEKLPLPKEPKCKDLQTLLGIAINTASNYRQLHKQLGSGATLAVLSKTYSEFKANSNRHKEQQFMYQKAEQQSWDTAQFLTKEMESLKCY